MLLLQIIRFQGTAKRRNKVAERKNKWHEKEDQGRTELPKLKYVK